MLLVFLFTGAIYMVTPTIVYPADGTTVTSDAASHLQIFGYGKAKKRKAIKAHLVFDNQHIPNTTPDGAVPAAPAGQTPYDWSFTFTIPNAQKGKAAFIIVRAIMDLSSTVRDHAEQDLVRVTIN
jgi:hypothetical protein